MKKINSKKNNGAKAKKARSLTLVGLLRVVTGAGRWPALESPVQKLVLEELTATFRQNDEARAQLFTACTAMENLEYQLADVRDLLEEAYDNCKG